jgi:hypothetical protein
MPAAASADRTRRSRLSSKAVSGIMLPSSISPGKEISGLPSSSARSLASWGEHRAGLLAQHVGIGARLRRLEAEQHLVLPDHLCLLDQHVFDDAPFEVLDRLAAHSPSARLEAPRSRLWYGF